ncbi:hypothetical protein CON39_11995 [Bacillus thuringiensis]|uniref:hypothetical protein n=1 Tax=Bacillus thuringiensis TaxID=1428 RepID=UPI000BECC606|nr:hypothetical protein [Bacillus thuringiensis]PEF30386.1 hypothetical protein CON39_11995 [Bacillus thuringiensis]
MNFQERLLQAENKGYTSVLVEEKGFAFFIEESSLMVGDIVQDSVSNDFKVKKILGKSRVCAVEADMDWEIFKKWLELEGVDMIMLSWRQTQVQIRDFENEKKQDSFSYRRALSKYYGECN